MIVNRPAAFRAALGFAAEAKAASPNTSNTVIVHCFDNVMAEGLNESSNLTTPPQDVSNPDLELLFDTLADWNHQLKHAKIDLKGPQL